jgi:hypothetical protein
LLFVTFHTFHRSFTRIALCKALTLMVGKVFKYLFLPRHRIFSAPEFLFVSSTPRWTSTYRRISPRECSKFWHQAVRITSALSTNTRSSNTLTSQGSKMLWRPKRKSWKLVDHILESSSSKGRMQMAYCWATDSARAHKRKLAHSNANESPHPTAEHHEIKGRHGSPHQRLINKTPRRAPHPRTTHQHVQNALQRTHHTIRCFEPRFGQLETKWKAHREYHLD